MRSRRPIQDYLRQREALAQGTRRRSSPVRAHIFTALSSSLEGTSTHFVPEYRPHPVPSRSPLVNQNKAAVADSTRSISVSGLPSDEVKSTAVVEEQRKKDCTNRAPQSQTKASASIGSAVCDHSPATLPQVSSSHPPVSRADVKPPVLFEKRPPGKRLHGASPPPAISSKQVTERKKQVNQSGGRPRGVRRRFYPRNRAPSKRRTPVETSNVKKAEPSSPSSPLGSSLILDKNSNDGWCPQVPVPQRRHEYRGEGGTDGSSVVSASSLSSSFHRQRMSPASSSCKSLKEGECKPPLKHRGIGPLLLQLVNSLRNERKNEEEDEGMAVSSPAKPLKVLLHHRRGKVHFSASPKADRTMVLAHLIIGRSFYPAKARGKSAMRHSQPRHKQRSKPSFLRTPQQAARDPKRLKCRHVDGSKRKEEWIEEEADEVSGAPMDASLRTFFSFYSRLAHRSPSLHPLNGMNSALTSDRLSPIIPRFRFGASEAWKERGIVPRSRMTPHRLRSWRMAKSDDADAPYAMQQPQAFTSFLPSSEDSPNLQEKIGISPPRIPFRSSADGLNGIASEAVPSVPFRSPDNPEAATAAVPPSFTITLPWQKEAASSVWAETSVSAIPHSGKPYRRNSFCPSTVKERQPQFVTSSRALAPVSSTFFSPLFDETQEASCLNGADSSRGSTSDRDASSIPCYPPEPCQEQCSADGFMGMPKRTECSIQHDAPPLKAPQRKESITATWTLEVPLRPSPVKSWTMPSYDLPPAPTSTESLPSAGSHNENPLENVDNMTQSTHSTRLSPSLVTSLEGKVGASDTPEIHGKVVYTSAGQAGDHHNNSDLSHPPLTPTTSHIASQNLTSQLTPSTSTLGTYQRLRIELLPSQRDLDPQTIHRLNKYCSTLETLRREVSRMRSSSPLSGRTVGPVAHPLASSFHAPPPLPTSIASFFPWVSHRKCQGAPVFDDDALNIFDESVAPENTILVLQEQKETSKIVKHVEEVVVTLESGE